MSDFPPGVNTPEDIEGWLAWHAYFDALITPEVIERMFPDAPS